MYYVNAIIDYGSHNTHIIYYGFTIMYMISYGDSIMHYGIYINCPSCVHNAHNEFCVYIIHYE
jgi:hypothetical protein